MEEYKKRFSTYSFAKPKTNIISLDSIQKQTYSGVNESEKNDAVVRVEVRRVSEVESDKKDIGNG